MPDCSLGQKPTGGCNLVGCNKAQMALYVVREVMNMNISLTCIKLLLGNITFVSTMFLNHSLQPKERMKVI